MKKMIVLLILSGSLFASGAHATTWKYSRTAVRSSDFLKASKCKEWNIKEPYSCTITVTGTLSAGFGSITATCSATEANCDLASQMASNCLNSVLRSLKGQLK